MMPFKCHLVVVGLAQNKQYSSCFHKLSLHWMQPNEMLQPWITYCKHPVSHLVNDIHIGTSLWPTAMCIINIKKMLTCILHTLLQHNQKQKVWTAFLAECTQCLVSPHSGCTWTHICVCLCVPKVLCAVFLGCTLCFFQIMQLWELSSAASLTRTSLLSSYANPKAFNAANLW